MSELYYFLPREVETEAQKIKLYETGLEENFKKM